MNDKRIKNLVISSVFIALTCIATMVIQIPSPMSGYVNLGDCMVLLSGWLLGPWYGACAAGIGSALADILTGYTYYAPATFLIKATMALVAGYILQKTHKKSASIIPQLTSAVLAEIIMVAGYFFYAAILLGNGFAAASSIPGNIMQGVFGTAAAVLLAQCLEKSHAYSLLKRF